MDSAVTKKRDKEMDEIAELQAIAAKIKPFPEKTRKMFKQALVEMEGDKILESDSIPMSRPKIRLLLNQINAQEQGEKPIQAKNTKDVLLTGMTGKAEREMFGKMVIQEREKNAKAKKNQDMKDLFVQRMEQNKE